MANAAWGDVYYKDTYAGRLQEGFGNQIIFTYDDSYIDAKQPSIAHTLPLRSEPFLSKNDLHPFFDNLVAEGWFRNAQSRALGIDPGDRFALLLGFGYDLAGAVSVIDPEPRKRHSLEDADEATVAALKGCASISGVQRKLLVVKEGNEFRPVRFNELSTHIAKLSSGNLSGLLELEYLTTLAVSKLLPDDEVVKMEIITLPAIHEQALVIERFDRSSSGKRLHHFEEFSQLLAKASGDDKYDGSYEDMGQFIMQTPGCIPTDTDRLFRRVLACLLVGNTDAHFKNFAMFHTRDGLRLTPLYDLVAASVYRDFQSIALDLAGVRNLAIGELKAKHIISLGQGFGLKEESILAAVEALAKQLPKACTAVECSSIGAVKFRKQLIEKVEKRWNGSFTLIGQRLLKKQN